MKILAFLIGICLLGCDFPVIDSPIEMYTSGCEGYEDEYHEVFMECSKEDTGLTTEGCLKYAQKVVCHGPANSSLQKEK